jgi:hypothetical protein
MPSPRWTEREQRDRVGAADLELTVGHECLS